ncbi:MAG: Uma2 family endonuclease [Candidatus Kapaibacterium sp.]
MMIIDEEQLKTSADYEELPEGAPYELINGNLIMSPSPSFFHQDISGALFVLMRQHAQEDHLGKVVTAPMDVYLSDHDVVQPDILFISTERLSIIEERIRGVPDLIVEILSPSNASTDLWDKRLLYERSGVCEYWIVDPERHRVEVYENVDGVFVRFAAAEKEGEVSSKALNGFTLNVAEVF